MTWNNRKVQNLGERISSIHTLFLFPVMHCWFSGNLVATPRCSERELELEHGSQYRNNLRTFFKTQVSWSKPQTHLIQISEERTLL